MAQWSAVRVARYAASAAAAAATGAALRAWFARPEPRPGVFRGPYRAYKAFLVKDDEGADAGRSPTLYPPIRSGSVVSKPGETYQLPAEETPQLCKRGFHACVHPTGCVAQYCDPGLAMRCVMYGVTLTDVVFSRGGYGTNLYGWDYVVARDKVAGASMTIDSLPLAAGPVDHRVVWPDGVVWHVNGQGRLHRDGGPAVLFVDGVQNWFQHGVLHREDGPAVVAPDFVAYYRHGRLHRLLPDPAFVSEGHVAWHIDGNLVAAVTDGVVPNGLGFVRTDNELRALAALAVATELPWLAAKAMARVPNEFC